MKKQSTPVWARALIPLALASIPAQAIVQEGFKYGAAGFNLTDLKRGIDKAVVAIVGEIKNLAKPTTTSLEIAQVGSIFGQFRC